LLSLADFRAPTFSLSVARDDGGLEDEFELFMQLFGTYPFVKFLVLTYAAGSFEYWISTSPFLPCGRPQNFAEQVLLYAMIMSLMLIGEHTRMRAAQADEEKEVAIILSWAG
jgi:hypothetical protein